MPTFIFDRDGVINVDSTSYIKTAEEFEMIPCVLDALSILQNINLSTTADSTNQNIYPHSNNKPFSIVKFFIASNQAGLQKQKFNSQQLAQIHKKLYSLFNKNSIHLEAIFFCPHFHLEVKNVNLSQERKQETQWIDSATRNSKGFIATEEDTNKDCICRKPEPGLLLEIVSRYQNLPTPIFFIGDSFRDLACADAFNRHFQVDTLETAHSRLTTVEINQQAMLPNSLVASLSYSSPSTPFIFPVLVLTGNGKKTLAEGNLPPHTIVAENLLTFASDLKKYLSV